MATEFKKIGVWSWSRDPSLIPVSRLVDEGSVEVVLWVSMLGKNTFRSKPFSYIPAQMFEQLVLQDKRQDVFYQQSTEQLNSDLNRFLDIYSRVNYSKGMDYHEHVHLFHIYYQYFTNLLISNEVDAVVYFGAPHVGVDYILYLAARALGVETVITMQSPVPNRFFCMRDMDDYGIFDSCKDLGEEISLTIPREHKKKLFYSAFIRNKRGLRLHKFLEDCLRTTFPSRQPISWTGVWQNLANRINYIKGYKRVIKHSADLNKKFVYFPLHMQPELSTSILGDEYSDQLLAVEKLSAIIPDDWYIYLKENPSQSASQRNTLFYKRLERIPNCLYLSEQVDTYDLIASSQFVASITGTACWEAISGGKPALAFGRIWYMNLPGITRYKKGISIEQILGNTIDHEKLEMAYSELMSRSIPGIIGLSYAAIYDEFDEMKNADLLTNFLRKVLKLPNSDQ